MALAPCPSCRRHVRVEEAECPFCSASVARLDATPDATTRMTRARLFVFATTVAATSLTFACPKENDTGGGIVQPYGAPMPTEQPDVGVQQTSSVPPPATIEPPPPSPTAQPAPTLTSTAPTSKPTYGPGGPVAMYGAPPPPNKPTP